MPALDSASPASSYLGRPLLFHLGTVCFALPLLHLWHARGALPALLFGLPAVLALWAAPRLRPLPHRRDTDPPRSGRRPGLLDIPRRPVFLPARIALTSAGAALLVLAVRSGTPLPAVLGSVAALAGWFAITRVAPVAVTALTARRALLLSAVLGSVALLAALPLARGASGPATGSALAVGLLGIGLVSAVLDSVDQAARAEAPSTQGLPAGTTDLLVLGVTLACAVLSAHGMTTGQPTERLQELALALLGATVAAAWCAPPTVDLGSASRTESVRSDAVDDDTP
ncbi:hypothetical protein SAMN05421595_2310 [Austwickia chelonae]|uniref:EccD-like transmembrane domain-containing protein n=1 Tax=Austwickia chelonae NBRC 105200 TaxID=1184607 RepID=K6W9Z6_9MICO|nr:hypothetical protein [Austwickia chelonae]GAB78657.1 hypothetical protein AUCHE_16_00750 [Austwickia chelonae NBRC 105200]SEW34447.1 hypothetical protein SAMN05421595_2310 [Austwickia chelonae]